MHKLGQHAGVFCAGLGLAALTAFLVPANVNPRNIFFVFLALFFVYLGVSLIRGLLGKSKA